jgi:hypothetical protein
MLELHEISIMFLPSATKPAIAKCKHGVQTQDIITSAFCLNCMKLPQNFFQVPKQMINLCREIRHLYIMELTQLHIRVQLHQAGEIALQKDHDWH